MSHKVLRGLVTNHPESLSAWTMIVAVGHSAFLAAQSGFAWRNILCFLHTFIHAPFSISYHACRETCPDRTTLFKKDAAYIFISGIILHAALSRDPRISAITLSLLILSVVEVVNKLDAQISKDDMKAITLRYIWVLLINYIPISLSHGFLFVLGHFTLFVGIYIMYSKRLLGRFSSAAMHCGLILNNWILHYLL